MKIMTRTQVCPVLTSDLIKWMDKGFIESSGFQRTSRLICADSFSMSVQAGAYHYCKPRCNTDSETYDYYTHFEVGFPSCDEELLHPYDDGASGVFSCVPKEILIAIVIKHGGIVGSPNIRK